jgi:hypothetical protein
MAVRSYICGADMCCGRQQPPARSEVTVCLQSSTNPVIRTEWTKGLAAIADELQRKAERRVLTGDPFGSSLT